MQVALIINSRCCFRLPVNTRFDTTCDTQHVQQEVKCNESNSQSDKSCLQTLPKAASQCREKLRQWNVVYKPHANRVNMTEPHTISSVMFHFVVHSISEPWFGRSVFASPGHLPFLKLGWKVDGSGLNNYEKDWLQGDRWREDDTSNTVTITRPLRLLQVFRACLDREVGQRANRKLPVLFQEKITTLRTPKDLFWTWNQKSAFCGQVTHHSSVRPAWRDASHHVSQHAEIRVDTCTENSKRKPDPNRPSRVYLLQNIQSWTDSTS